MYEPRHNNVSVQYRQLSQESLNNDSQFPAFRFLVIRENAVFGGSAALVGLGDRGLGSVDVIVSLTPGPCTVPGRMEGRLSRGDDESTLKGRFGVAKGGPNQ